MTDSPDLGVGTNRDRPLRTGFGIIPHQLWTLPNLTPNQRCLLGWLHSHADNYLARLTLNRIGNEYGCGTRAGDLIRALQDDGWVRLIEQTNGHRAHVVVLSDPWENLLHHSQDVNATVHKRERDRSQGVNGDHSQNVNAEKNTVEAQPEHQEEHHALTLVADNYTPPVAPFETFWNQYPRKVGKAEARKRWAKMTPTERQKVFDALDGWIGYYATIDEQFIPHGSTWLNQRRWEDDVPRPAPAPVDRKTASSRAAINRLRTISDDDDLDIFTLDKGAVRELGSDT